MGWRVTRRRDWRNVALVTALLAHLSVSTLHGGTHALVPVWLPAWQNLLVLATTFVGPVVGVVLAWRDHPLGVPLFTASMAGAFLVGSVLHFLVEGPDAVHVIPPGPWRRPFQVTAVGVAVVNAVGTAVGAWYWYTR